MPLAGQFQNTIKLVNIQQIVEIASGIYPHLSGKQHPFCIRIFIAHPQYFDGKKRRGIVMDQVEEKKAVPATAHYGNINGKPLIHTDPWPFVFCSHPALLPVCLKVTRQPQYYTANFIRLIGTIRMWRQNSRSVFRPGCPTEYKGKANDNLVKRMTTGFALLLA